VAKRFIESNSTCWLYSDLPIEKKDQLIQLLEMSITHALCPIDELAEEEDELASARTHNKREYFR
jgi:hypothetical protein